MAIAFFMIEIEKIDDHHPIAENICFITRAISRAFIAWWRHNSETNERLFSGWITLQRALLIFNRTLRVRDQWRVLSNVCSLFCFSSLACMIDVFCNPLQGSAAASFKLIFYFCLSFPTIFLRQLLPRNQQCSPCAERSLHCLCAWEKRTWISWFSKVFFYLRFNSIEGPWTDALYLTNILK